MSPSISASGAEGWADLAEAQMDDAIHLIVVKTRVSMQLQRLRLQAQVMGMGAKMIEDVLGDGRRQDDENDRRDRLRVGRVLDRYL